MRVLINRGGTNECRRLTLEINSIDFIFIVVVCTCMTTCTSEVAQGLVLVFSLFITPLALALAPAVVEIVVEGAPNVNEEEEEEEEEERVVGKEEADDGKNEVTPPPAATALDDEDDEEDDADAGILVGGPNPIVVTPLPLLLLPPVRRSFSKASIVSLSSSIRSWVLLVCPARSDLTGLVDWARSDLTGIALLLDDEDDDDADDDDDDDDDTVAVSNSFNKLLGWYTLCWLAFCRA